MPNIVLYAKTMWGMSCDKELDANAVDFMGRNASPIRGMAGRPNQTI